MENKRVGGWFFKERIFAQTKIADGLWYYERRDGNEEKQVYLFFVGWYERPGGWKLYSIGLLFLSIQVGLPW